MNEYYALALKIADYLTDEWEKNYLVEDVKVIRDYDTDEVKVEVILNCNLKNKADKFNELLDEVFRRFGEYDEIWDITFTYN